MERKPINWKTLFWSIRPINLILIAFTQYIFHYLFFQRQANQLGYDLNLKGTLIYAFICTTLFITIGGYLINDYIDHESDIINRKKNKLSNKWFYLPFYFIILLLGLILSIKIAFLLGHPSLILFYLLASSLLFLYSTYLKKTPLVGNIIVATFSASVVLVFFIFEYDFLNYLKNSFNDKYSILILNILFYTLFVFCLNLIRELVKDLEDVIGDKEKGYKTLAIENKTLTKTISLVLSAILLVFEVYYVFYSKTFTFAILGVFAVILPQVILIYKILQSESKRDFNLISHLSKINMFLGLLFLFITHSIFTT